MVPRHIRFIIVLLLFYTTVLEPIGGFFQFGAHLVRPIVTKAMQRLSMESLPSLVNLVKSLCTSKALAHQGGMAAASAVAATQWLMNQIRPGPKPEKLQKFANAVSSGSGGSTTGAQQSSAAPASTTAPASASVPQSASAASNTQATAATSVQTAVPVVAPSSTTLVPPAQSMHTATHVSVSSLPPALQPTLQPTAQSSKASGSTTTASSHGASSSSLNLSLKAQNHAMTQQDIQRGYHAQQCEQFINDARNGRPVDVAAYNRKIAQQNGHTQAAMDKLRAMSQEHMRKQEQEKPQAQPQAQVMPKTEPKTTHSSASQSKPHVPAHTQKTALPEKVVASEPSFNECMKATVPAVPMQSKSAPTSSIDTMHIVQSAAALAAMQLKSDGMHDSNDPLKNAPLNNGNQPPEEEDPNKKLKRGIVKKVIDDQKKLIDAQEAASNLNTANKLSAESIEEGVKWVMKDSNKIRHLFKNPAHNLDPLVEKLGGHEQTVRAILRTARSQLPNNGVFKNIPVVVEGFTVYIRGSVVGGIPKLGTMFIKSFIK